MPNTATATPTVFRIGYLTANMKNFQKVRELGQLDGFTVDLVPPDAPVPEPDTYHALIADFAPNARHELERKTFLEKLVRIGKKFPLVVFDQTMNYPETNVLRAAGIKWFPVPTARAFPVLRARAAVTAKSAPAAKPQEAARNAEPQSRSEDSSDAGSEPLSTRG
jgi:hypothetical protein